MMSKIDEIRLSDDIFTEIIFNLESDEILRYRTLNKDIEEIYKSNEFWKRLYHNKFYYVEKIDTNSINYEGKYKEEIKRNNIREIIFKNIDEDNQQTYITSECFDIL